MQITDVRVRKVTKEGKMKAVVSITIDDEFVVHDIKVIEIKMAVFCFYVFTNHISNFIKIYDKILMR